MLFLLGIYLRLIAKEWNNGRGVLVFWCSRVLVVGVELLKKPYD